MWKRLNIYEGMVYLSFICIMLLCIVNQEFLNYIVPKDIAGYLFWLSLGLLLGFQLCKYEMKRVWKKSWEEENQADKQKPPISPN
jgi:cadmium resistance protein CadD (predicted permease)